MDRPEPSHVRSINSRPRYSVIIPAYQAAATLPACLAALADQDVDPTTYEVIVVDDGSKRWHGRCGT